MRISAHGKLMGVEDAIKNNADIISDTVIFEDSLDSIRVRNTDTGKEMLERIKDLTVLLKAYEQGTIKETEI